MLPLVSAVLPLVFLGIVGLSKLLRGNPDIISESLSELAIGPFAWLGQLAFLCVSIMILVFTIALSRSVQRRDGFGSGVALLYVCSACFLLLVFFHTTADHQLWTTERSIHVVLASTVAVAFPIACFLISPSFRKDPVWHGLLWYTIITGLLGIALDANRLFVISWWSLIGLQEILLISNAIIWIEVASVSMLRLSYNVKSIESSP